ncbi:Hsp20/alpha crystallin family protein [Candidatus Parcubacteria bacterium]|nr:MAG: Hsp20/alpha crystallin family protein [Candidatus Parcubacteria bacterium]
MPNLPKINAQKENEILETEPEGQLTIDVFQTPNDIVIESAVAGVNPDDLDITATSDSITIRGERRREKEVKDDDYFYQECYWGRFSRSVILPQEVDPDGAAVSFKNGILTVRLPKLNRQKSKKLKVKSE